MLNVDIDTASPVPPYEQLRSGIAWLVSTGKLGDGVVETHGRRGTFVSSTLLTDGGELDVEAEAFVVAARRLGYTVQEATRLVKETWGMKALP